MIEDIQDWVGPLQRVNGEFTRDAVDRWMLRAHAALFGMFLPLAVVRHQLGEGLTTGEVLADPGTWVSVVGIIAGAWLWRESGMVVRFDTGLVSKCTKGGALVWERTMAGLTRVTRISGRGGELLRLEWPDGRKFVSLSGKLESALAVFMPKHQDSADDDLPDGDGDATDSAQVPAGPSWRCGKCGEENPGNFEMCWKCEAARS